MMFDEFFASVPEEIWDAGLRFLGSLVLLVMIVAISIWKKMKMSRTFIIATLRGFGQMLILASVLFFIFQLEGLLPLFGVLTVMIIFGAQTAATRVPNIHNVFKIELIALWVSVTFIMSSMSLFGVLPLDDPAFWIPVGGMVTGNSMNISYLALDRIQNDIQSRKDEIEAALSLGASPDYLMQELGIIPTGLRVAVTPNTNNLKTLGLVFIPGLMTGLLIGGMHPIAAAFLQVMIFFLILGGGLLAALIASMLVNRNVFDPSTHALDPLLLREK